MAPQQETQNLPLLYHEAQSVTNSNATVQLPIINLPDFDGSYIKLVLLYDTFTDLMDKNAKMPESQKFHYLKSCLKDEPRRTIGLNRFGIKVSNGMGNISKTLQ